MAYQRVNTKEQHSALYLRNYANLIEFQLNLPMNMFQN